MDAENLPGRALSRDIAKGEAVEYELDRFISARHDRRVIEEGERAEEEAAWRESTRKAEEKRRIQARHEWHAFHCDQASRHRRNLELLARYHEERAEELMTAELPEDAA